MTPQQFPDEICPQVIRQARRSGTSLIPLCYQGRDGDVKFRAVPNIRHATLCRAFGFDPASFWFDVSDSMRALEGSTMRLGAGGNRHRGRPDGYVMRGRDQFGTIFVVTEDHKFRDDDPQDMRDFFDLSRV